MGATASESGINSSRLLALSKFLQKSEREYETEVCGGSMGSALPSGSRIRIRFAPGAEMVAGNVIAYAVRDSIVAHRVVRRVNAHGASYLLTRGDATVLCDPPIREQAVIGIVIEFRVGEGWYSVPTCPKQRGVRRLLSAVLAGTMGIVLRGSPAAARLTALSFVGFRSVFLRSWKFATGQRRGR